MKNLFLFLLLPVLAFAAPRSARLVWAVETSNPTERPLDLRRGESVDLECRFTSYAAAMDLSGCLVKLHAVTNGMAAGESFQTSGTITNGSSAAVSVSVDSWLPGSFTSGGYTLEVTSVSGVRRLLRASGKLTVSGLHYPSAVSPVPVSWATNIYAILETKLSAADVLAGDYVNVVPDGRRLRISATAPVGSVSVTNKIVRLYNAADQSRSWVEVYPGEMRLYTVTERPCWRLAASDLLDTAAAVCDSFALPYPLASLTNAAAGSEFRFGAYRLTVGDGILSYTVGGDVPGSPSVIAFPGNTATGFTNTLDYSALESFNPPYGTQGTAVLTYGDYGYLQTNVLRSLFRKTATWVPRVRPAVKTLCIVATNSTYFSDGDVFTNALAATYDNVYNRENWWIWLSESEQITGTNEFGQLQVKTIKRWLGSTSFENTEQSGMFGYPDRTDTLFPFTLTNSVGAVQHFYQETR